MLSILFWAEAMYGTATFARLIEFKNNKFDYSIWLLCKKCTFFSRGSVKAYTMLKVLALKTLVL